MKVNAVINTMVEAMAEKIDRLKGELFCKDYEIEKLKDENESLKKAVENLKKALVGEEE
jgi:peptidoglycan hydrolase CwlO-like protein